MRLSRLHLVLSAMLASASLSVSLIGCSGIERRLDDEDKKSTEVESGVPEELSLKSDRSHLDELRKDVPEDVRRDNDELATVIKDMSGTEKAIEPSKIRDRFQRAVRSRRSVMDSRLRKERETFNKTERDKREAFLSELKRARDEFASGRRDKDERKRFFDEQDGKRKEFFAEQTERRKAFESSITERRKDFEDYMRERNNQFNQELRAYTQAYHERRKNESLKSRMEDRERRQKKTSSGGPKTLDEELAEPASGKITPLQAE